MLTYKNTKPRSPLFSSGLLLIVIDVIIFAGTRVENNMTKSSHMLGVMSVVQGITILEGVDSPFSDTEIPNL